MQCEADQYGITCKQDYWEKRVADLEAEVERLRAAVARAKQQAGAWFGPTYEARREGAWIAMGRAEEREACALRLEQEAREAIEEEHGTPAHAEGLLEAARLIRARGEGGDR